MTKSDRFFTVFAHLKTILTPLSSSLVVKIDVTENYSLNTPFNPQFGKELFFAAVQIKKNDVSFHLMPIYIYPELLNNLSVPLKKRIQGKSCFNFTSIDEPLFVELEDLVKRSIDLGNHLHNQV